MLIFACIHTLYIGVRYFIRGVDDDGHVANYVETEQMMIYRDYRASFVQVISICESRLDCSFNS